MVFACSGGEYVARLGRRWSPRKRAQWLQKWCRAMLRALSVRVEVIGPAPAGGFLAPNHLSYIDILVLGSIVPQVFLSKSDVAKWPVVGLYTKMAGTLYINRRKRSDVANKELAFGKVIEHGLGLTVFLEGTSSDGTEILPFRASLLDPVVRNGWPVTPTYLKYGCDGGNVGLDVCWWGDMPFGSHLVKLAGLKAVTATVVFGQTMRCQGDRKEAAVALRNEVVALKNSLGQSVEEAS